MKYLKNNLMNGIAANLLIFGILAVLTVILPNNAFGQRDLSAFINDREVSLSNISEECRQYKLAITTGDVEGAEQDGNVFVTIKGNRGSTDRIDTTAGASLRRDNKNPNGNCRDLKTGTPSVFVTWGDEQQFSQTAIRFVPFKPFANKGKAVVNIYAYDVGEIESITIEHDDWYPNWFVRRLEFSSGETIINREVNRWFRPGFLLKQTFPVQQPPGIADYLVSIYTGDVYQGGTNANVSILLNRHDGSMITEIRPNEEIPGNPLERNQTDYTGLYNRPLLSNLGSITVSLPVGQRWFLGTITINGTDGFSRNFGYNNWVKGGEPVTLYHRQKLGGDLRITHRNEGFYNAQMIVSYMMKNQNGLLMPTVIATSDMPIGQNSVIGIPLEAENLQIILKGFGTVKNDVYASELITYPEYSDLCFKSWGSTLSPQGGTCDGNPIVSRETPLTEPIKSIPRPRTIAEKEQDCFDFGLKYFPEVGFKKFDQAILQKICKGTPDPLNNLTCLYNRYWKIGEDNAIVQCQGDIPLEKEIPQVQPSGPTNPQLQTPSAPTNLNIRGANASNTNIAQNELDCFNQVQNKVAYDTAGSKTWNENNIKNLCRGTTNPASTISCFSQKMPQVGWAKATQECAATNISSQTQRVNQMPVPSQNQPTSTGISLEGSWEMYNDKGVKFDKFAKISQSGSNISINNGYGANSTAVLSGNSFKTSDGLTGTVSPDGTKITWNINYVWVKQVSTPVNNQIPVTSPNSNGTVQTANSLGTARDIDAKNGAVWIIGTNPVAGGYGIYKFNGSGWTQIDGGATRIAVDNTGNPWVVNAEGAIFRRINDVWTVIPGIRDSPAADIAVTQNGNVWVVTTRGLVSRWTGSGWTPGRALQAKQIIALPNSNSVQIVENSGKRWTGESEDSWLIANDPTGLADKYIEFAVDGDTKWVIDSSFNIQKLGGGNSQGNYTVAETQVQPTSTITNVPAQTKRSITFRNEAGFVAKMMVQYFEAGPGGVSLPKFLFTDNIPVGQSKTLEIPNSVPNTQVMVNLIGSGTMKDNFFTTNLDSAFTGNRCFKAWGTLFSPQGGTCQ